MKKITVLIISAITAVSYTAFAQAATLMTQLISTPSDSSTLKETVQGCSATSINYAQSGVNTIFNLYGDGTFELGYDANLDNTLTDGVNGDVIILTGVWSNVDAAATKFKFQPDGNLAIGNGTFGWLKMYDWTVLNACVAQTNGNVYNLTYPPTFRILKSDMTHNSSNAGTLRFTLEGYGQTATSLAIPPATAPKIKYDMQVKGFWQAVIP
jgi:hypothetical protein